MSAGTDPNGTSATTRVIGLTKDVERLWNGNPSTTAFTYDVFGQTTGIADIARSGEGRGETA